jgi:hypothetical protein
LTEAWKPHPGKQEEFCGRGEFEALFGGAAGPGKTQCLIALATRYIQHPRYTALIIRRTFPQLQEIIDRCWQMYPALGGVYRSTEHRWYFPSGATINLGHMQHEDDKYNFQGKQYNFCVAPETPVLMANGKYAPITDIRVGDFVQTLAGSRPVTHKFTGLRKPSVELTANGASQIQSADHRVLQAGRDNYGVFLPCGSFLPTGYHYVPRSSLRLMRTFQLGPLLHAVRDLGQARIAGLMQWLLGRLFLLGGGARMELQGAGICSVESNVNTQVPAPLVLSRRILAGRTERLRRSVSPAFFERSFSHGWFGGRTCSLLEDYQDDYSADFHQCDGLLLAGEVAARSCLRPQAGVVRPIPIDSEADDLKEIQICSRHISRWGHPYTLDIFDSQLPALPSLFSWRNVGLRELVDIRVQSANHYITKGGIVNANCGFDELTQFSESQYLYMFSRGRTIDAEIPTLFRSTSNPGGIGHVWVKNRFVDCATPGKTHVDRATGLSRVFIPAIIYDNPTLVDNDPGYISRLEALPDIEKRRLLHGDWSIFEGQVFPELSQLTHGCQPFDIPPEWDRYLVFDWGFSRPFAALWFAIDYDLKLWLYREWYGTNGEQKDGMDVGLRLVARDVAVKLNEIEFKSGGEKIKMRIADPAIFNTTSNQRRPESFSPSIAEDFMSEGIFFQKADNDRSQGIQQVHKRFQLEEFIDKSTGEVTEEPRVQIFNNCTHFWRTMPALQNDPRNVDDVESKYQDDHIYDCFRYMCMARPVKPQRVELIPPGSFAAERNKLIRARKYASQHGISLSTAYSRMR